MFDRLLVNWEPLKTFFKEEVANKNLALTAKCKATKILDSLKSRSTRLYIMFLSYNIKVFEAFLTANQSDKPKAPRMQSDCRKLIRNVQICFVAPSAAAQGKLIEDVDYKSSYNHKDNKNIMIGEAAREFISNKAKNGLTEAKIAEFFTNVKLYFTTCADYILKNLPISDPFLKHLEIADPDLISPTNLDSVRYPAQRYPILLSGCTIDILLEEFSSLQCCALQLQDYEPTTAEQFWLKLSKTNDSLEQPYKHISTFMLGLLTIPHSSAHCERIFSAVRKIKTDIRSSISAPTLEAILVLKHRKTAHSVF
ncbi:hypothetical protein PoB_005676500 [Plakobranchus ocellatus]|uniref:HAT C-terminal dimerisation domain-containing protein n=1 Tax=Plakobranchus ocellatus TaxID=259542 RepID=A0AAV4CEX3_9GAST|nr:hypothetical protein PoB_005676500 [Plakobranchus ocellatus]